MRVAVVVAVAWTVLYVTALLMVGGRPAPCPDLGVVGIPGTDREAIAAMCDERDRPTRDVVEATQPWSWLAIWGLGIGAITVGVRVGRSASDKGRRSAG